MVQRKPLQGRGDTGLPAQPPPSAGLGEPSSVAIQELLKTTLLHFSTLLLPLSPVPRLRQGSGLPLEQTQPSKKAIACLDVTGGALWIEATAQAVLCLRCGSYRHTTNAFCLLLPVTKHPKTLLCHQFTLRSSLT